LKSASRSTSLRRVQRGVVVIVGIVLWGCGGEDAETRNLADRLGTDVRFAADPGLPEPAPRFTPSEESALSDLLQGNVRDVASTDLRDLDRKLEAFAASSRSRHRNAASEVRALEHAGLEPEGDVSTAERRLLVAYNRLARAVRTAAAAHLAAVRRTLGHDRRLIELVRSATSPQGDEYRSALKRVTEGVRSQPLGRVGSATRAKGDRALRLGLELSEVIEGSPELRRLAATVERRYPRSLLATVVRATGP
jgi:hypothetical protein